MGTTISDVALDLGSFALDNEIETGRMIVIHFAPPTELTREHKGPRGRGRQTGEASRIWDHQISSLQIQKQRRDR
jgi:hypothetical protein